MGLQQTIRITWCKIAKNLGLRLSMSKLKGENLIQGIWYGHWCRVAYKYLKYATCLSLAITILAFYVNILLIYRGV